MKNDNMKKGATSPTTKEISSEAQAMHNDVFSLKHARDVVATLRAQLKKKGFDIKAVDALCEKHLEKALAQAGFPGGDPEIDLDSLGRLKTLKDNLCFDEGKWEQKRGQDWLDFFVKNKNERAVYKDSSGSIRKPGQARYSSPLKQIFFRLPPWIAKELGDGDEVMVKKVMTLLADMFRKATGLDVIAVNIHREHIDDDGVSHDLHGHLIYSDVIKHEVDPVKVPGPEKRAYMAKVREEIIAELKTAGKNHGPTDVKRVRLERGILEAPKFKPSGKHEYRRMRGYTQKGKDASADWSTAKRKLNVLGSAYRYKAMLYEASTGDDRKEILNFREPFPKAQRSFSTKFLSRKDPEEDYLDYWLEKKYADLILSRLPDDRKEKIEANKAEAVANFLEFGTSVTDPVTAEWDRMTTKTQKKLDKNIKKSHDLHELEDELLHDEVDLEIEQYKVTQKFEKLSLEADRVAGVEKKAQGVLDREGDVTDREAAAVTKNRELRQLDTDLEAKQIDLDGRVKKLISVEASAEERIQVATELEDTLSDREDEIREGGKLEILSEVTKVISPPVPFKVVTIQGVSDLQVKLRDHTETSREEGRREILDEVSAIIPPSIPEDPKAKKTKGSVKTKETNVTTKAVTTRKTRKEVLKDVSDIAVKATIWDRVKSPVMKIIARAKPSTWLKGLIGEIKCAMGIVDDVKDKKDQDVER